jgi:hypothetical protein
MSPGSNMRHRRALSYTPPALDLSFRDEAPTTLARQQWLDYKETRRLARQCIHLEHDLEPSPDSRRRPPPAMHRREQLKRTTVRVVI